MSCEHSRRINIETRRFECERCGADWESLVSKKPLYCACFMVRTVAGWSGDKLYFHAENLEQARLNFFNAEHRVVREVQIAPVVGWLANDDNADSVSA